MEGGEEEEEKKEKKKGKRKRKKGTKPLNNKVHSAWGERLDEWLKELVVHGAIPDW